MFIPIDKRNSRAKWLLKVLRTSDSCVFNPKQDIYTTTFKGQGAAWKREAEKK